jgi:high-affinity iron transporter
MLVVTALAVLREGSETVLFLYSLTASGANHMMLLSGGLLGLAGGTLLGLLFYRGLLYIPMRHFFTVTGWVILLLAAGLAANAAGYLTQAGLLPGLYPQLWDSSHVLSQESLFGQLLHILIGYNDRPTAVQLVFYLVTLATIGLLMRGVSGRAGQRSFKAGSAA